MIENSFVPMNPDGSFALDIEAIKKSEKMRRKERLRAEAFCKKSEALEKLIKALGSQGIGCGHVHHSAPSVHLPKNLSDEESQQVKPEYPVLEVEEAEDFPIKAGKVGEIITSLGGAFAIGPVLDLLLKLIAPHLIQSLWFKSNEDLEVSPGMLLVSLALVAPAIYGAPHCHAQLEIASRTRNNFLILAKYSQQLLRWGQGNNLEINAPELQMPAIKIGTEEIAIDRFTLTSPSDVTPLTFKQKIQIIGDVEQHFNEYVGLSIIAILRNIRNPIAQLALSALSLFIAAIACRPEVTTCANTLVFMNTLKNAKIIDNPESSNKANAETTFSAIAKTPAVLYANLLSFQEICFGNFYAGLCLALLATKGNIITQYFINTNTQAVGESQVNEVDSVDDKRTTWKKLSLLGKELVVSRAFGTGNERSEPITIGIIALAVFTGSRLSPTEQAILALSLCLMGTVTAYSEARNAADHTARIRFFNTPLTVEPENDAARNSCGIRDSLL